jgi:hypothetical protein
MVDSWVPALLDGVELAGGPGHLDTADIACVFYGDVFRGPGRFLGELDEEALEAADVEAGAESDLLMDWWREASAVDSAVVPPQERTLGVTSGVQAALAALACSKFLAGASERALVFWLTQVRAYFTQPLIREEIQRRFAAAVTADTQVVVAHSLGSVVAYEALCAHPEWAVQGLVTLGSPLGIRNIILDRLIPAAGQEAGRRQGRWPGSVRTWTNVADRMDFVALVKKLQPVFGEPLLDVEIDNGARMHAIDRYLTAAETGAAILGGLRDGSGTGGGVRAGG